MDAITCSSARANLARTMDRVCDDHEALIITRNGEQSVVMLSLEDFQALEETAYLLRNPSNAKRLLSAAAQLAAGKGVEESWRSEAGLCRRRLRRLLVLAEAAGISQKVKRQVRPAAGKLDQPWVARSTMPTGLEWRPR